MGSVRVKHVKHINATQVMVHDLMVHDFYVRSDIPYLKRLNGNQRLELATVMSSSDD